MRSELFAPENMERQSSDTWTLQSSKMLRVVLNQELIASKGAMVAYQGRMSFEHQGSGSLGRFLKRALTQEDAPLMRVSGQGEVFLARRARNVFLMLLEGESLTVNSESLLAFDASLHWDIQRVQGAGVMTGGLWNTELSGHGYVAVCCDGDPMVLDASAQPTFVDPQAAVCWPSALRPGLKNDLNLTGMFRGGSGEAFQLAFHGPGFVVVQPSEGTPVPQAPAAGSGGSGIFG